MRGGKTKCYKFRGIILPHFCNLGPKIALNQTIFADKNYVGDMLGNKLGNNGLRQLHVINSSSF